MNKFPKWDNELYRIHPITSCNYLKLNSRRPKSIGRWQGTLCLETERRDRHSPIRLPNSMIAT